MSDIVWQTADLFAGVTYVYVKELLAVVQAMYTYL